MIKDRNIPWERIEARLNDLGKDAGWLRSTLEIESNVITNWKSRGAPAREAVEIAIALETSTDRLLGMPNAPDRLRSAPRWMDAQAFELLQLFDALSGKHRELVMELVHDLSSDDGIAVRVDKL